MNFAKFALCFVLVVCFVGLSFGGKYFPNIEGYQTFVCDFHTHTVFSDGHVWPSVRVHEAKRESIDVIAITDHIEYLPHKNDLPKNLNRSYQIAKSAARKSSVLVVKGAEITRDTPPGHYNAIFINDVIQLDDPNFLTQIENANLQNGFVFWNHHTWQGKEKGMWSDLQTTMHKNGWLHGMEVANGGSYYPLAHKWCLEKKLTMLGNSDIHPPSIDHKYTPDKHRSLTLVFAKERTKESVRQALDAGRTAVWYKNKLIGKEEYLSRLFKQIVKVSDFKLENGSLTCKLTNSALIDLNMERKGKHGPEKLTIPARSSVEIKLDGSNLKYCVKNFLVNPKQSLLVEFSLKLEVVEDKKN
ncbi:MAG: histidinol-phosphatase [Planctomycetes bacterium]|nr:histidinol-phosphatase [Planctomycetota bacterium]